VSGEIPRADPGQGGENEAEKAEKEGQSRGCFVLLSSQFLSRVIQKSHSSFDFQ
jgi:hypothetical protein